MKHSPPLEQRQLERLKARILRHWRHRCPGQLYRWGGAPTVDDFEDVFWHIHTGHDPIDLDDPDVLKRLLRAVDVYVSRCMAWKDEHGYHEAAAADRSSIRILRGLDTRRSSAPVAMSPPSRRNRRRGAGRPRAQATRRSSTSRDDGDDGPEDAASPSGEVAL